jgi:hypothetical protein
VFGLEAAFDQLHEALVIVAARVGDVGEEGNPERRLQRCACAGRSLLTEDRVGDDDNRQCSREGAEQCH